MSLAEIPLATSRTHADWGKGSVSDYFALMKPRVMSLVVFTALAGLLLAPSTIDPIQSVIALLCIAVGAGASGALNMWWDADIDGRMPRTARRPVPAGRIAADEARNLGIGLGAGSVIVLGIATNLLAAVLLALTIVYYVVFYTMWLKRKTVQNIVIGGAAGAFPPMIGWAAATGSVSLDSLVLFLIIFLWTPPHFWALALIKTKEYENVGVPMLPVVAGPDATRLQILLYSLVLVPVAMVPSWLGTAGTAYAIVAGASGLFFLWRAWGVYRMRQGDGANAASWRLFSYSIFYLFLLFATLIGERLTLLALQSVGWL